MSIRFPILAAERLPFSRRALAAGLALIAVIALAGAAWLTQRVGESLVSVGMDIDTRLSAPPLASWGEGDSSRTAFEAIPDAFAPAQPSLVLLPTAEKNSASGGNEVWVGQHPRIETAYSEHLHKRFHPFTLGQRHLWYRIDEALKTTAFTWERNADTPVLVFLKTPNSGMVRLQTANGEKQFDLYSPEEEIFELPAEDLKSARYYASVPRRALGNLQITFGDNGPPTIHRFYIGTLLPRIFFSGPTPYPLDAVTPLLGTITTNWKPQVEDATVTFHLPPLEQGGLVTFVVLFVVICLALAAVPLAILLARFLLRSLLANASTVEPELRPIPLRRFFIFLAAFIVVYLFYLGCAWPGLMSPDSIEQWEQAKTWDLTDDHPALHTLSYKLIATIWDNTAAVALIQVLSMSLTLAYACYLLLRAGVPNGVVLILFHIALLSPKNGILGVTLWKDIPFSILVLAISTLLLRLCFRRSGRFDSLYWIGLGVMLGFLPLLRHNGLVILFGIAPLLPILYWRWKIRALVLATVLSLALFGTVKYGVYSALDVKGWDGLNVYLYTVKSAILIDQDVPLAAAECDLLNQVRAIDGDRWAFNSHTGNTTVNGKYNEEFALDNAPEYERLFNTLAVRYPLLLVQDHYERSHYVYMPGHPEGRTKHHNHYLNRPENPYDIQQRGYRTESLFPGYAHVLGELIIVAQRGDCMLLRPAVCLYLVLLSVLIVIVRQRAPQLLAPFLPALFSTLSVLMIPIASQIRYQFPLTLAAAFLVGLAFMPRTERPVKVETTADE